MTEFNKESYLAISVISSILGMAGAIYQIFIRKDSSESRTPRSLIGRRIIVYLAYSDFFASFGIFFRSTLWSFFTTIIPYEDDTRSVLFCSISSVRIEIKFLLKKLNKLWNISILGIHTIILHSDMVVDVHLCIQYEASVEESRNKREKFSCLCMVSLSFIYCHRHNKSILSKRRVSESSINSFHFCWFSNDLMGKKFDSICFFFSNWR